MAQQYLSTDPNAGQAMHLSTDPNAGATEPAPAPPRPPGTGLPKGARMYSDVLDETLHFLGEAWNAIKPWDKPQDIIGGPVFTARHPLQAAELLLSAFKDAHLDQAVKATRAKREAINAPTMGRTMLKTGEALGRTAAAVVPGLGPALAAGVEQAVGGDVSGGLGRIAGIGAATVIGPKVSGVTQPGRAAAAAGRLAASAERQMGRALNPTRIDTKVMTQRVAPEMLKRRVAATSLEKLEQKAAAQSDIAGAAVGRELAQRGDVTRDVLPMVDELEKAKTEFVGTTTTGGKVVNEPAPVKAIEDLQNTLMEYGDQIDVRSMAKLRRNWDATVKRARGFVVQDLGTQWAAWARREGRSVLREELAKAAPDLQKLNAEFSFWESVEDIAHATNERRTGQSRGLLPTIAGAGGAAAADLFITGGASTATKVGGTLLTAKLAASLKRILESPGYNMLMAVQKQRLADALASRNGKLIADAIGRTSAALAQVEGVKRMPQLAPGTAGQPSHDEKAGR